MWKKCFFYGGISKLKNNTRRATMQLLWQPLLFALLLMLLLVAVIADVNNNRGKRPTVEFSIQLYESDFKNKSKIFNKSVPNTHKQRNINKTDVDNYFLNNDLYKKNRNIASNNRTSTMLTGLNSEHATNTAVVGTTENPSLSLTSGKTPTVFDWKVIDQLSRDQNLPVLKRVKRSLTEAEEVARFSKDAGNSNIHKQQVLKPDLDNKLFVLQDELQSKEIRTAVSEKSENRYNPKQSTSLVSNLTRLVTVSNAQNNKAAQNVSKPAAVTRNENITRKKSLQFRNYSNENNSNFQSSFDGFNKTSSKNIPRTNIINDKLVINVLVCKDGVKLYVNNNLTYSSWNNSIKWPNEIGRLHAGVHVVTLHATTGRLMRAVNLMTWQMASAAELVKEIRSVNSGRLLVLVGAPDFMKHFSSEAIDSISSIGSNFIGRMAQYESFVLISRSGGGSVAKNGSGDIEVAERRLYEAVRTKTMLQVPEDGNSNNDGPSMYVEAVVERVETARCPDSSSQSAAHRLFCERYEGYGAFCACDATLEQYLEKHKFQDQNMTLPTIAVALIGCRRTPQVLQQLGVMRRHTGGKSVPTVMCLDRHNDEAEDLARLLNVSVVVNENNTFKEGSSTRVNHIIQWSLSQVFAVFPDAEFAIIVEDDLQLSPDFIPFFRQTTTLLADPKELLLCVNAYNYLAYPETASNYSRLIRHQGPPGFGWMITRAVAKELEEFDAWPLAQNPSDWDFYLKSTLLGTRQILAPEVPRTRHAGGGGVHVTGLEQERYFNRRVFNKDVEYVKLDVDSARRSHYYKAIRDGIQSAVVLDLQSTHPCHPTLLEGHPDNTSFVMYLDMPTEADEYIAFGTVMKCFGCNDRSTHEQLMSMYLIHRNGHTLYIVACPRSYYCQYNTYPEELYQPSMDDVMFSDVYHYTRWPQLNTYTMRVPADPSNPSEEFQLTNIYERKSHTYTKYKFQT